MALRWKGWKDGVRDWWMMGRLKWEETDWCYLLAMLHTLLDQHTAQCLYPFILSSLSSLVSLCLSLWSFSPFTLPSSPLTHTLVPLTYSKHSSNLHFLSLWLPFPFPFIHLAFYYYSLLSILLSSYHQSDFFAFLLSPSLCPSVCLSGYLSLCHLQCLVWVSGNRRDRRQSVCQKSHCSNHMTQWDTADHCCRPEADSAEWETLKVSEGRRDTMFRCVMRICAWMNV